MLCAVVAWLAAVVGQHGTGVRRRYQRTCAFFSAGPAQLRRQPAQPLGRARARARADGLPRRRQPRALEPGPAARAGGAAGAGVIRARAARRRPRCGRDAQRWPCRRRGAGGDGAGCHFVHVSARDGRGGDSGPVCAAGTQAAFGAHGGAGVRLRPVASRQHHRAGRRTAVAGGRHQPGRR